jgi:hypothetical protein
MLFLFGVLLPSCVRRKRIRSFSNTADALRAAFSAPARSAAQPRSLLHPTVATGVRHGRSPLLSPSSFGEHQQRSRNLLRFKLERSNFPLVSGTTLFSATMPSTVSENESALVEDTQVWTIYEDLIDVILERTEHKLSKQLKKENSQLRAVREYLLRNARQPNVPRPPPLRNGSRVWFADLVLKQKELFLQQANFTKEAYQYYGQCLVTLAEECAKRKIPAVCIPAWYKLRECGHVPRENSVSTILYVFTMQDEACDFGSAGSNNTRSSSESACLAQLDSVRVEVASFHDLLYEPSENTMTIRIKSLIGMGDPAAAEQILSSLPDKKYQGSASSLKRLRTFAPILRYYCEETGDMVSALRLYRQMKESEGVHLDSETCGLILGSAARHGWFNVPEKNSDVMKTCDLTPLGFTHSSGPEFFDELVGEMAKDIVEIDESSANLMINSFHDCFCQGDVDQFRAQRVTIDVESAACPESGATLRLFTLSKQQRQRVYDSLFEMANHTQEVFGDKLRARRAEESGPLNVQNGTYAVKELSKFSDWLRFRKGPPFTAIVDGPNVAYFGHGDIHWNHVKAIVDELEQMGEHPLVIMPQKYTMEKFYLMSLGKTQQLSDKDMEVVNTLVAQNKLYIVSSSCLDDYYWMLGSVAEQSVDEDLHVAVDCSSGRFPGLRPMLITNDQMRDHRLALLEERLFRRWTSCHIVNYSIINREASDGDDREVKFFPADCFSREIQGNPAPLPQQNTVWHFPVQEWPRPDRLCISIPRK